MFIGIVLFKILSCLVILSFQTIKGDLFHTPEYKKISRFTYLFIQVIVLLYSGIVLFRNMKRYHRLEYIKKFR